MTLEQRIRSECRCRNADFIHFVDISRLAKYQHRRFSRAVLIGMILSPDYLETINDRPDYVEQMKADGTTDRDEFNCKEKETDLLADFVAEMIEAEGHTACSQSERHLEELGIYDAEKRTTPLPHKTIAGLAGLGWIGRHNLLVTPEYGSAISMCTVLTDAPLTTSFRTPIDPQCGYCTICRDICQAGAITGRDWRLGSPRHDRVDVNRCTTCLRCLAACPWTVAYIKNSRR